MSASLATPNFSADSSGKHTNYVQQLSHKYAALSKVKPEEQSSEPDGDRMLALRGRIQEAWSRADGDPSSGKWVLLTRLLRMGVTSGRAGKWVGARIDLKPPECPGSGWLNTTNESDWREWERKFIQDHRLKNMVETWKKGVEAPTESQTGIISHRKSRLQPQPGVDSDKQNTKCAVDPLKDAAPFGFGVVKRSNQINVLSSKPSAVGKVPYDLSVPGSSKGADNGSSRQPNGAEASSMRPSFSDAQLVTSTPKRPAKPTTSRVARSDVSSLIPLTSSPGKRALLGRVSSLASPRTQDKKGQGDPLRRSQSNRVPNAASLPAIASLESPLRHITSNPHDVINTNNKRIHSSSHSPVAEADDRQSKKAKTIPVADVNAAPQTPPRQAVPTLTELLASVKKSKKKRPSIGKALMSEKEDPVHTKLFFTTNPRNKAKTTGEEERVAVDNADEQPPPFFDPSPIQQFENENREPEYDFYAHLDDFNMGLASPAKSLSSIAGASDGEEDEAAGCADNASGEMGEFALDSSFRPLATSTQVQGDHPPRRGPFVSKFDSNEPIVTKAYGSLRRGRGDRNATDSWESIYALQDDNAIPGPSSLSVKDKNDSLFPQLSYNSQFQSDVAAQVAKVNKLLQRDVGYDGLLGREEEELHGDPGHSSDGEGGSAKNGYSYGYGKAFEYDESF